MDSPETNKIVASTSSPPAVQDSPFFNYLSNLSPIKPVKAAHVARGLAELNFPPPPPVFTSPHINPKPETKFVNRSQYAHSSNAKLFLECGDRCKTFTAGSNVSGPPVTRSMVGLISCTQKGHDSKSSVQVQASSPSGGIDEYLADPVEVDSVNSADLCLKHSNDAPQVLLSGCMRSKETIMKLDDHGDGTSKDIETEMAGQLTSLEQSEEVLLGKSLFHDKSGQQTDSEEPSDECPYGMSDKVSTDSSSIMSKRKEHDIADFDKKRAACSESLCYHKSHDVMLQNTDGGQQGESECSPRLLPEPLQIVPAYGNYDENSGALSNGSVENRMLYDYEGASQHHRGMRRRCLQFEAAEARRNTNNRSCQNPKHIPNSKLPANPTESKILDSPHLESSVTSSHKQPFNISQSITSGSSLHPVKTPEICFDKVDRSVQNIGNSSITGPKPSGIGLHLNSIVNATSSAAPSMKLAPNDNPNSQREKLPSVIKPHLPEESNSNSLPTSLPGKFSANNDDDQQESQAIVIESSATFHSSQPHENADRLEFNQLSPKKKRKKTSYSMENEGCKRCNCRRSKCLKLYCECFAAGVYCAEPCACQECFNKPEYEDTVLGTRQQIESRNPLAFAPKVVRRVTESPANSGEDGNRMTPSSARHKRGCNCKKSMCLKKYCECYQAGVGCSVGCRCEGCKNVFGIKEGYREITEMVYKKADDDECWEDEYDGKLDVLDAGSNFLHPEQCHARNLSPLTPLFQPSGHGKDVPKSRLPARRYIPSPESDDINILSSYGKSPRSRRSSDRHDMQAKVGEGNMEIVSYDLKLECSMAGTVDQFSPRWDGLAEICDLTPLPHPPSRVKAFTSSSNTRGSAKVSGVQLCHGGVRLSSVGSFHWRSSPVSPMPELGGSKMPQEPDSESGYEILEDDTPEILKDTPTPIRVVKARSPNQKRVSPPHSRLHELRQNSSPGLRSGRKFVLQSISSFPPLTPYSDPRGGSNDK